MEGKKKPRQPDSEIVQQPGGQSTQVVAICDHISYCTAINNGLVGSHHGA